MYFKSLLVGLVKKKWVNACINGVKRASYKKTVCKLRHTQDLDVLNSPFKLFGNSQCCIQVIGDIHKMKRLLMAFMTQMYKIYNYHVTITTDISFAAITFLVQSYLLRTRNFVLNHSPYNLSSSDERPYA